MRLLHTTKLHFEEFIGSNIPEYAILSHTWEEEEVSFADMKGLLHPTTMKGYQKIKMTCDIASKLEIDYAWVDTCCIDKSSSAELTEAINSMYRWYGRSKICFTYLEDLLPGTNLDTELPKCRWFTRGWTLQELISPKEIHFFDRYWNYRGSKTDLIEHLSKITSIDRDVLLHRTPLSSLAVAQKMSWAANRHTTRYEDMAYCLLGIFDVNMPLLYGEEEKAFRRLQEEIIKSTPDLSIFAWTRTSPEESGRIFCSVLAPSPQEFISCTTLMKVPNDTGRDFSISNRGVKIHFPVHLYQEPIEQSTFRYMLPLDCCLESNTRLAVRLRKCGHSEFIRENPWKLVRYHDNLYLDYPGNKYILADHPRTKFGSQFITESRSHVFKMTSERELWICNERPSARYDEEDKAFFLSGDSRWDNCGVRIVGPVKLTIGQDTVKVDFAWWFYILGWSSMNAADLKCTLIDYELSNIKVGELLSDAENWGYKSTQMPRKFTRYKIPKSSAVVIKVKRTKFSIYGSFTLTLEEDARICRNKFWKVHFYWRCYKDKDVPIIPYEVWD